MGPIYRAYRQGLKAVGRVHAVRLCAFFIIACFFLQAPISSLYAQEPEYQALSQKGVIPEYLSIDDAIKIQNNAGDMIDLKRDIEESAYRGFQTSDVHEQEDLVVIDNDGLPRKLVYSNGKVVEFNYKFDNNGDLDNVTFSSRGIDVTIAADNIDAIADHDAYSPECKLAAQNEDGETIDSKEVSEDAEKLIQIGSNIPFDEIEAAFANLGYFFKMMMDDEKEDSGKKEKIIYRYNAINADGNKVFSSDFCKTPAREEMYQAVNNCAKTISRVLENAKLSSARITENSLEIVIILPEKKR